MQTFVCEQYALEAWKIQLVFVQTCYVNIDSRYSKNADITTCEYIQNGQNVRPTNTLKYLLSMIKGWQTLYVCSWGKKIEAIWC